MRESQVRFIRQLGYVAETADEQFYSALMLQPRIVGVMLVLGIVSQRPLLFLVLAAALLWGALLPSWSVFDAIYNYAVARPRGVQHLGAAPAPRRFAAGLAGAFALAIAVAFLAGDVITAWLLEGLLALAVMQVVFRDVCAGANVYHLLRRSLTATPSHPSDAVRH